MEYSIFAVKIGDDIVNLDDLSIGFWEQIAKDEPDGTMAELLTGPMRRPALAMKVATEAARLLGKDQPGLHVANLTVGKYGEPSLAKLGDLFVLVESDLPKVGTTTEDDGESVDGVPSLGDEQLTSTSPS